MKAKRELGQNFLIDKNIIRKIMGVAALMGNETVVEVGAGKGVLTKELCRQAKKVIAVEVDRDLLPLLTEATAEYSNIEIIRNDIKKVPNSTFGRDRGYVVIANIPYNLTSYIIRKFLDEQPKPSRMLLMIQKEVGLRICARPTDMNLLALSVQYFANPHISFTVSRNSFMPRPAVDSCVIELVVKKETGLTPHEEKLFFQLAKIGFGSRRKLLLSNIAKAMKYSREKVESVFEKGGVTSLARAQELSLQQWIMITKEFARQAEE